MFFQLDKYYQPIKRRKKHFLAKTCEIHRNGQIWCCDLLMEWTHTLERQKIIKHICDKFNDDNQENYYKKRKISLT